MPSLIRLVIVLLFFGGLIFAGMFALVTFVEPTPKEVSQRIPTRDLLGESEAANPAASLPQPNVTSEPATSQ